MSLTRKLPAMIKISRLLSTLLLTGGITLVFSQLEDTDAMASPNQSENTIYQHVSTSNNKFCDAFYSNVAAKITDNVVCSPLSAHLILSLVAHGARGKTLQELKDGLHLPNEDSLAHNGFKSLLDSFHDNIAGVELNLASKIYVQKNVSLIPDFLSISSEFFYSETSEVDFGDSGGSIERINSWVEKKTHNKIKEVITKDDVNELTQIVLVNAIYFKGAWKHQFKIGDTENRPFYMKKDLKVHVPTMFTKSKYAYGQIKELNAKLIELPYENKDFSMIILLPNEIDGLQFLEMNFNREHIENVHWQLDEIELFLPKFKIECGILLEETLQEMGMKTMFSNLADFSGITLSPLKVDKIIQKAFIEVNEEGSEAVASTEVKMRKKRMALEPETFQVDRPFLFAIQHKPSNITMFVGSVRNLQIPYARDEL